MESQPQPTDRPPTAESEEKLPMIAHIACGWPVVLVLIGGAIGGGLAGVAYGANLAIYRSTLPLPAKILLNLLTGVAAFGLWLAIATVLRQMVK